MDKDTFTNKLKELQKHNFQMGLISETRKHLKEEDDDMSNPVGKLMLELIESINSKILEHGELITEIENELIDSIHQWYRRINQDVQNDLHHPGFVQITFDANKLEELQKLNFHIGKSSTTMEHLKEKGLEEDKMVIEFIKRKILEYGELITKIENELVDSIHQWE